MQNGNLDTEKYKRELMELYSRSAHDTDNDDNSDKAEEAPDDTAYAEHIDEEEAAVEDYNSRYPEPDLSELDTDRGTHTTEDDEPPEYASEELLGSDRGYILVNVRTGDDSSAVEGAVIAVTAVVDGKRLVLASGTTDSSGVSPKFALPVPHLEHSQTPSPDRRPYNLFDVSVGAEGFFRARSVDVPVFSGITSVQNFSLIPLPLMMDSDDETVTYYNAEPSFGSGEE